MHVFYTWYASLCFRGTVSTFLKSMRIKHGQGSYNILKGEIMAICEYNPKLKRAAYYSKGHSGPTDGCQNEATIAVGRYGQWHLCKNCAALPEFERYKKRHELERSKNGRKNS